MGAGVASAVTYPAEYVGKVAEYVIVIQIEQNQGDRDNSQKKQDIKLYLIHFAVARNKIFQALSRAAKLPSGTTAGQSETFLNKIYLLDILYNFIKIYTMKEIIDRLFIFGFLLGISLQAQTVDFTKLANPDCASYKDEQTRGQCQKEVSDRKTKDYLSLQGAGISNDSLSVIQFYPNLSSLDLSHSKVNDSGLSAVSSHPKISFIKLSGTSVSARGLSVLSRSKTIRNIELSSTNIDDSITSSLKLPNLYYLNLSETRLSATGAESLVAAYPNLHRLDLAGTPVSDSTSVKFLGNDAALKYAVIQEKRKKFSLGNLFGNNNERMNLPNDGFGKLNDLNLSGTKITNESIYILSAIKKLRFLDVSYTSISDEGMKDLPRNMDLEVLGLSGTFVTDRGIKKLKRLKNLQVLSLESSFVTDKGLQYIEEIPSLRSIYLKDSKVTLEGVKRLQLMLPDLKIHYPGYKKV